MQPALKERGVIYAVALPGSSPAKEAKPHGRPVCQRRAMAVGEWLKGPESQRPSQERRPLVMARRVKTVRRVIWRCE